MLQGRSQAKSSTYSLRAGYPMQIVAVDILGPFSVTSDGNRYVFMVSNCFTKWVIPNQEAATGARNYIGGCVLPIFPTRTAQLHADQGRQFEADFVKEVCSLLQINKFIPLFITHMVTGW